MPIVHFTPQLQRHVSAPSCEARGDTVRLVLEDVFHANPGLRGYVLDDQGNLRPHVTIFVDGVRVKDRSGLSDPVGPRSEVFVLQALSGG